MGGGRMSGGYPAMMDDGGELGKHGGVVDPVRHRTRQRRLSRQPDE